MYYYIVNIGISAVGAGGFVPYPGYAYYLNDLWAFNLTSGFWREIIPHRKHPSATTIPEPRSDFIFELLGKTNVILLHGGYGDNQFFDDMWYYNITTNIWVEKKTFVYPLYPVNCTDDIEYILNTPACTEEGMTWPKHLERNS